jgi:FkbM family methyltransferase
MLRFILFIPVSIFKRDNQMAFEALGECKIKVKTKTLLFKHANPRFIDEIIYKHCYEPYPHLFQTKNPVFIDAGANIGTFTVYVANQVTEGKIISIEPENRNFQRLKDNIRINELMNVELVHAALSDINDATCLITGRSGSGTIMSIDKKKYHQECKTITMNSLILKYEIKKIDFLKIDIEGAEFLIFKDSKWLEYVDVLVMEIHTEFGDPNTIINVLQENNFLIQTASAYDAGTIYLMAKKQMAFVS